MTIVETAEGDLGRTTPQLTQRIAAGSGAGDVVAIEEGQVVNFLQNPVQLREPAGASAPRTSATSGWSGSSSRRRPPTASTRSGSAPTWVAWPCATAAICSSRPGCPTDREEVGALWADVGRRTSTSARSSRSGIGDDGRALRRLRDQHLQLGAHAEAGADPGYTYFDTRTTSSSSTPTRPSAQAWDMAVAMDAAGLSAELQSFSTEWNAGFKNGNVRHDRLPGLDDRLHRGAVRRRERGQLGHRHGARRQRQLGRLVPRRPDLEREPGPRDRTGRVPDQRRRPAGGLRG